MRLRGIHAGDVVVIYKRGWRFDATVDRVDRGALAITPHSRRITYRTASAREVIARHPRSPHQDGSASTA